MKRAAKRDANERDIIEALEACGVAVTQLSQAGVPDLLCSVTTPGKGFGKWFMVEVKSDKGKLTEDQYKFIDKHNAWVHIARSRDDVDRIMAEP